MQETRVGELLIAGATENASLTEFEGLECGPGSHETKDRLNFVLRRNRYGWRMVASGRDVPPAFWPRVPAHIAQGEDSTPFMYMFLREIQGLTRPSNVALATSRQGRRKRGQTNQTRSTRSKT
jgi:hypothetical protein